MKTPQEKYENDPDFKKLVDIIHALIEDAQFSPSEVREASVLACIHYEMLHVRSYYTVPSNINDAIKTLADYRKNKPTIQD